jgi:predicted phage tail protein
MISIYGHLARKLKKKYPGIDPKNIDCRVKSAGEAVRAIEANYPGFRSMIRRKGYYKVIAGNDPNDDEKSLGEKELAMNFDKNTNWHIVPMASGFGGKAGVLQMVLGAVLVVIGIVMVIYTPYNAFGWQLIIAGGAMMLGGLVTMLTPLPELPKSQGSKDDPSYLFNGSINADEPGLTVPVAYGETYCGSIVTSFGVTVEDY